MLVCEATLPVVVVIPGQAPRQLVLTRPAYELEAAFSQIGGIRELSDGRFVISDGGDGRLMMADAGSGRVSEIPFGSGMTSDIKLLGMAGDSTLVVDKSSSRLMVVGPDGRAHRSFSLSIPGVTGSLAARAVDDRGRYYAAVSDSDAARQIEDSLTLVRIDPQSSRVDTIARMQPHPRFRTGRRGSVPNRMMQPVPFASQDTWTVDQDGTLIAVRSAGYRLEFSKGPKKAVVGPKTKVPKVKVTSRDKALFKRALIERSTARLADTGTRVVPSANPPREAVHSLLGAITFPSEMGAFTPATPLVDRLGRVWVQRWVHMDDNETWDVFDRSGKHSLQVELPDERRLVSMGPSGAWVVARDADGVERIERYDVPNV